MFQLCSAILANIGTCLLYMAWDNPVVLLLMYMFMYQFKLLIIATTDYCHSGNLTLRFCKSVICVIKMLDLTSDVLHNNFHVLITNM